MENNLELIRQLQVQTSLDIPGNISLTELTDILAGHIRQLIHHDFAQLVAILYRMDISQERLTQMLNENKEEDAGYLISGLLIEREREKIKSRMKFQGGPQDSEEERW